MAEPKVKLLAEFTQEHQIQLHKYLNFFSQKKQRCIQEVERAFEQVRERNSDKQQLFSKMEMLKVLEDMEEEMRQTFKSELEIFYRMSGVMIQMIMHEAEKQNTTIKAEIGYMENYKALQEMKEFEKLIKQDDFTLTKKPSKKAALPGLGSLQDDAQKQVFALTQKQRSMELLIQELQENLEKCQLKLKLQPKADPDLHDNVENLQAKVLKLEAENQELKEELDKKINQTAAVIGMKKMIQDKNVIINELRQQLGMPT